MSKLLPKSARDRLALTGLLVITVGVGSIVITTRVSQPTASARAPQLYVSPGFSTLSAGGVFSVQIRENSGATSVNAVQANLSYPTDKLEYVGITDSGTGFGVAAQATTSNGLVKIARGTTTPDTGDQLVATVNFNVKSAPGTANLAIAPGSALVTSTDNTNMLNTTAGGAYEISKPATSSVTSSR